MPADWSRLCHGLFWFVTPSPHWPSAALLVHYDLSMRDVAAVLWPLVPSLLLVTGLRGAWGVIMAALVWPLSSPTLQCVLWMIWSHFPFWYNNILKGLWSAIDEKTWVWSSGPPSLQCVFRMWFKYLHFKYFTAALSFVWYGNGTASSFRDSFLVC